MSLLLQTITTDMLVLAVVKEVRDYEIVLSLPGGAIGFLRVTDISKIYTNHLAKMAEDEEDDEQDIAVNRVILGYFYIILSFFSSF